MFPDPDLGSLHPGDGSNCWLSAAGGIWCWGDNDYGKFGNGTDDNVYEVPVQPIGMESGVVSMEAGEDFYCAITDEARLFCWGRGSDGQLGYGEEFLQSSPVEVVNEDGAYSRDLKEDDDSQFHQLTEHSHKIETLKCEECHLEFFSKGTKVKLVS